MLFAVMTFTSMSRVHMHIAPLPVLFFFFAYCSLLQFSEFLPIILTSVPIILSICAINFVFKNHTKKDTVSTTSEP